MPLVLFDWLFDATIISGDEHITVAHGHTWALCHSHLSMTFLGPLREPFDLRVDRELERPTMGSLKVKV